MKPKKQPPNGEQQILADSKTDPVTVKLPPKLLVKPKKPVKK